MDIKLPSVRNSSFKDKDGIKFGFIRSKSRSVDDKSPSTLSALKTKIQSVSASIATSVTLSSESQSSIASPKLSKKEAKRLQREARRAEKARKKIESQLVEYEVKDGDTLNSLAAKFNCTPSELCSLNRMFSRNVFVGQLLKVPPSQNKRSAPTMSDDNLQTDAQHEAKDSKKSEDNKEDSLTESSEEEEEEVEDQIEEKALDQEDEVFQEQFDDQNLSKYDDEETNDPQARQYLKINVKQVTQDDKCINGVILLTPENFMFSPDQSESAEKRSQQTDDDYLIQLDLSRIRAISLYNNPSVMYFNRIERTSSLRKSPMPSAERANLMSRSCQNSPTSNLLTNTRPVALGSLNRTRSCRDSLLSKERRAQGSQAASSFANSIRNSSGVTTLAGVGALMTHSVVSFGDKIADKAASLSYSSLPNLDNKKATPSQGVQSPISSLACESPKEGSPGISGSPTQAAVTHRKLNVKSHLQDEQSRWSCGSLELEVRMPALNETEDSPPDCENNRDSLSSGNDASISPCNTPLSRSANRSLRIANSQQEINEEIKSESSDGKLNERSQFSDSPSGRMSQIDVIEENPPLFLCISAAPKTTDNMCGFIMPGEFWFMISNAEAESLCKFLMSCHVCHVEDLVEEGIIKRPPSISEDIELDLTQLSRSNRGSVPGGFIKVTSGYDPLSGFSPGRRRLSDQEKLHRFRLRQESVDWELVNRDEVERRMGMVCEAEPENMALPDMDADSKILDEGTLRDLLLNLPAEAEGNSWTLVYSTEQHGCSLKTLYRKCQNWDKSCIMLIQDDQKAIFGAMLSNNPHMSDYFYGNGETYVFRWNPIFEKYRWSGDNNFFIKGSRNAFSVGCSSGHSAIWLDDGLKHGQTEACDTFRSPPLSPNRDFIVSYLELWSFLN